MIHNPSQVRRQGRRMLDKLEGINLKLPLGPGFHAELVAIARDLSEYKEKEWN